MINQSMTDILYIFTDGGAINNGKKNCKAAWSFYINDNEYANGEILLHPSNQKGELYAIFKALEYIKEKHYSQDVLLVTDSQYSIKCLTLWCKSWMKNGWKTSKGENVKHYSLIQKCCEILDELKNQNVKVTFEHIRSHQIQPVNKNSEAWYKWNGNFKADELVSQNIQQQQGEQKTCSFTGKTISIDFESGHISEESNEREKEKEQEKGQDKHTLKIKKSTTKKETKHDNAVTIIW